MTISNIEFENRIDKNQIRTRYNPIIGESFLLVRFCVSIVLTVVVFLVNAIYDFTYTPIYILFMVQLLLLILGGLFFSFSLRKIKLQVVDYEIRRLFKASMMLQFLMIG